MKDNNPTHSYRQEDNTVVPMPKMKEPNPLDYEFSFLGEAAFVTNATAYRAQLEECEKGKLIAAEGHGWKDEQQLTEGVDFQTLESLPPIAKPIHHTAPDESTRNWQEEIRRFEKVRNCYKSDTDEWSGVNAIITILKDLQQRYTITLKEQRK